MGRFKNFEKKSDDEPKEKYVNPHFSQNHDLAKRLVEAHGPKFSQEYAEGRGCRRMVHAFNNRFEMAWTENNARFVMMVVYNQSTSEFKDEVRRAWSLFEKKK